MSPTHKQRIVGAAVLVALLLIIVPAVLDFSRDERNDMKGMEIPPGPDAMKMEVLPLEEWSQKVEPGVDSPAPPVDVVAEGRVPESVEPPQSVPDVAPPPAPPQVESKPVAPAPSTPAVKVAPVPAAPKREAPAVSGGWIVQVASLSVEAKANELRDKLRKAGHPAQVESAKGGSGTVYRVKAGPVASRDEAETLKRGVKETTGLDGLIRQSR